MKRNEIFKSHLGKIFAGCIAIFFVSLIFSHWIQQLVDYSQKFYYEQLNFDKKCKEIIDEIM